MGVDFQACGRCSEDVDPRELVWCKNHERDVCTFCAKLCRQEGHELEDG